MEEEGHEFDGWEGYVDWRNKPARRDKHGGMLAASFVLVVEVMENMAFISNTSNMVTYLTRFMHFQPAKAAINQTNFVGTAFFLALLGGFLSDAFFTAYQIYLMSAAIELLGLMMLLVQARSPALMPAPCDHGSSNTNKPCEVVSGGKALMLFTGLYLLALGAGGIKGSLPAHGAEQFDENTVHGQRSRSTFFNYFIFSLSCGVLLAVTFVVWMEDNEGWQWGFGISAITLFLSIPVFLAGSPIYRNKAPKGSPLTTIAKVITAAICNTRRTTEYSSNNITNHDMRPILKVLGEEGEDLAISKRPTTTDQKTLSKSLWFLNRAVERQPFHQALSCTPDQLEEVKVVVKLIPIFLLTIMLSCCLAQLGTFSIEQATTMDTKLGPLKMSPASLTAFPVTFIMIFAPVYDHIIVPLARKVTKIETGITHLQRMGVGLVLSIVSMAVAAVVEVKRKQVAWNSGILDMEKPLPISFFWVALQYFILGSADLFTLTGMLELFFTETPPSMRSLAMSLCWTSLAMGNYLSSVIVSMVNDLTGGHHRQPWLAGKNLNYFHLERFYWLLCALSLLNFALYLFFARRYKYRSMGQKD